MTRDTGWELTDKKREKRALNIVWTAAERYGFRPDFLAFRKNGEPDVYLNAIVGFVHKRYDAKKIAAYLSDLQNSWLAEMFSDIFWLALENAVFLRERKFRPSLVFLRLEHARDYLDDRLEKSMQSLMIRNDIVCALKSARCREILGKKRGLINPWEIKLYEALAFNGEMTTDEIIQRSDEIRRRFFIFRFGAGTKKTPLKFRIGVNLAAFLQHFLQSSLSSAPRKPLKNPSAGEERYAENFFFSRLQKNSFTKVTDKFPEALFSKEKQRELTKRYCSGNHADVKLYYAGSRADEGQAAFNKGAFNEQRAAYRTSIRHLRDALKNCLEVSRHPLPARSRNGEFSARYAWRADALSDSRVFTASESVPEADFTVTLLIDASYSRASQQGIIASQAYVVAEALAACAIPFQALSFCSLEGYTVISRMKAFEERDNEAIFSFGAIGWNRDGLALRAVRELLPINRGEPLLIVFSDARPSDDHPFAKEKAPWAKAYDEEAAILDAANEVRGLRNCGVRVAGLIHSELADAGDGARAIFGHDFARIERIDRLAPAAASLIERRIRSY